MDTLPHKHNIERRVRKAIYRHLLNFSFRDQDKREIVCTKYAIIQTQSQLATQFAFTVPITIEAGEILLDSRGAGTFQKMKVQK